MPANGSLTNIDYSSILDEVFELLQKFSVIGAVLWIGDMNASLIRSKPNRNDQLFRHFCVENELEILSLANTPTYHHFDGKTTSQIDYAVTLSHQTGTFIDAKVEVRHPLNTSTHDAVICTTSLLLAESAPKKTEPV